jgi:hypothetical protein
VVVVGVIVVIRWRVGEIVPIVSKVPCLLRDFIG